VPQNVVSADGSRLAIATMGELMIFANVTTLAPPYSK
jgi:hypothetical protein